MLTVVYVMKERDQMIEYENEKKMKDKKGYKNNSPDVAAVYQKR